MGITTFVESDASVADYLDEKTYAEYFPLLTQLKAALANDPRTFMQFLVEYHGSGDSGDYEPAELSFIKEGVPPDKPTWEQHGVISASELLPEDLIGLLSDFLTEKIDYDWYNNDGGGGTAYINLADGMFGWDGWYNVVEQHPEVSAFKVSD